MSVIFPILIIYGFSQIPFTPEEPKDLPLRNLNEPTLEEVIGDFDNPRKEE